MKWNIDPILFQAGPIAIRYYSLMFIIGFISMGHYVKILFKKHGHDPKLVDSLVNHIIIGMLVGSRLFHCFFYDPGYYLNNPLEILMIWKGGLASHGGYLGVIIAIYLFVKKYPSIALFSLLDICIGPTVFVGGLIRIGNFFNSEIIGRATDLPWAITFEKLDNIPRHPAQLYESLGYFCLSFLFIYFERKKFKWMHRGAIVSLGISLSFTFRFFIEFVKDNQSTISNGFPINMGQILSIGLITVGLFLYSKTKKINQ